MQQKYFKRWVLPAFLVVLAALFSVWPPALHGQTAGPSLQVCRTNVSPCQDAISLGVGDVATVHLVLSPGSPPPDGDPKGLLAWETHLVLSGDKEGVGVSANPPVQAPDAPTLSLAELSGHSAIDPSGTRHFPVQNRFDPTSGLLDYAVVLVGADSPSQWAGIPLSTPGSGITLGSVQIEGVSPGTVVVSGGSLPSQVVIHEPGAGKVPVHLSFQGPLATLSVGSVTTPSVAGRILGLSAATSGLSRQFRTVRVSLWEVGAVPPWRGGTASPKATFDKIELSADGAFEVLDISPSLAPPGPYVIRVKLDGALSRAVSATVLPRESGSSPAILEDIPSLLYGDSNGDNRVDSIDVDSLKDAFGYREEFPIVTDFNHDGITDAADFSVMDLSYGEVGE